MYLYRLLSDQLYTWSDGSAQTIDRRLAQTPSSAAASTAAARCHPAWLSHRALQTLWQAGMQVCRGRGHGPKYYLSVSYPGLRPQMDTSTAVLRPGHRVAGQLPASSRAFRADLRDQPRTPAPPRVALKDLCGHSTFRPSRPAGCRIGRCAPRQYARSVARQRPALLQHGGGIR